jgi:cytochrome P450
LRDPLSPEPPRAAHYDYARRAWVLSRYDDVVAGLRELPPMKSTQLRDETRAALAPAQLDAWRAAVEPLAAEMIGALPRERGIDLAAGFIRPWSRKLAALVTGAVDDEGLYQLAREVSAAAADPDDEGVKRRAEAANAEMESAFPNRGMAGAPAYVALSQTLPALLANAWLALLRHPAELARLAADPAATVSALDELLRYAGFPRALFRTASAPAGAGGVTIAAGDRVILEIASANRDPARFADPDRLDLYRDASAQLALGAAPRHCPGSPLIRMAMGVATAAFARAFPRSRPEGAVEWRGGAGFQYPATLRVARIQ